MKKQLTYEELQAKFESTYSIDMSKDSHGEYVSMATFNIWSGYRWCAEEFGIFDLEKFLGKRAKERKERKERR